ncbi:alpha/beta fold hydrolase [Nocardia sp. NPDC004068]|uniref:alpha/beta fold hydrolase n=1 Tax=Nocardia sp. NPDC004068 TaxID=3364303 RepID=UPI003696342B
MTTLPRTALAAWCGALVRANAAVYRPLLGTPPMHSEATGDGRAVLLLNGYGASGRVWPHDLAECGRTVVRVDARGTGESCGRTAAFTIADLADDARAVMLERGIATATVVGWSLGGMVAQELALRHPEAVDALVLVGTVPPSPAMELRVLRTSLAIGNVVLRGSSDGFLRALSDLGGPGATHERPERMREIATAMRGSRLTWWAPAMQGLAAGAWRGPERLRRIAVPVTVLHGADDPIVPLANAHRLGELIPHARVEVLDGVGHLLPFEAADRFLAVVRGAAGHGELEGVDHPAV